MANLVRINARIGQKHNEFLDKESKETGISKSALIQLAVDQYMTQKQGMATMERMLNEIKELKKHVEK